MWIKQEIDSQDLEELLWGQAQNNWNKIKEANKEREAMQVLEEITSQNGEPVELMYINDIIAFEPETVYEAIGLNENGEEQQEWSINRGELDELKSREILSQEQIEYIEGEFYGDCSLAYVSEQDFIDNSIELDDAQKEELNEIVA